MLSLCQVSGRFDSSQQSLSFQTRPRLASPRLASRDWPLLSKSLFLPSQAACVLHKGSSVSCCERCLFLLLPELVFITYALLALFASKAQTHACFNPYTRTSYTLTPQRTHRPDTHQTHMPYASYGINGERIHLL